VKNPYTRDAQTLAQDAPNRNRSLCRVAGMLRDMQQSQVSVMERFGEASIPKIFFFLLATAAKQP
jgi:hypothetical protein